MNVSGQWGAVISDGAGGIIVAWKDYRHATFDDFEGFPEGNEVYLQRVDKDGNILYGTNGKLISGPASDGWHQIGDMKTDHNGGFYIGYANDSIPGMSVLKHFDNDGSLYWQRFFPGSFIDVCATDLTGDVFINYNLFENRSRQKLDLSGQKLWPDTLEGIIYDDLGYRHGGAFSDGNGGVIGIGPSGFLTIRRVDSTGQYAWDEVDLNEQQQGLIGYAPDTKGGLYVCWTEDSMRIQRIEKNGNVKFNPPLKIQENASGTDIIQSDGGVITIYGRAYDGIANLFAQKFDSNGVKQWPDSGLAFHITEEEFLWWPVKRIFSDFNDGTIFLWTECCNGNQILLKQISANGILGEIITNIQDEKQPVPTTIKLYQNYPNPFNNSTTLSFRINSKNKVTLKVFNTLGEVVRTMVNAVLPAGTYSFTLAMDHLASGVYYYQLKTGGQTITKKMLLIR